MSKETGIQGGDAPATGTLESEINELLDLEPQVGELAGEGEPSSDAEPEVKPIEGSEPGGEESGEVAGEKVTPEVTPQPESVDEISALKAQIESLTSLVSQLSAQKEPEKKPELAPDLDGLIESVDFDEIMESKAKFMEFFKGALNAVVQSTQGYVQGVVPQVVTTHVGMQELRENFYKENSDLNAVRPYVAMVASNVASEHPDWEITQVMGEAAKLAREALKIPQVKSGVESASSGPPPVLPGAGGARKAPPQKSKLQSEIDELLED